MRTTQQQFLDNIKTQIYQYVYRSIEAPQDAISLFLQEISGNGNLNWHKTENKQKIANVYQKLSFAINAYTINDGDFRTYVVLRLTDIIISEYEQELFKRYVEEGYNVTPESVVGALSDAYSLAPPQNTNFPGIESTANSLVPEPVGKKLIASSLYSVPLD